MINRANTIQLTLPSNVNISYKKNLFYRGIKNDAKALQHVRSAVNRWYYEA